MRISDWSSDVCSSDLRPALRHFRAHGRKTDHQGAGRLPEQGAGLRRMNVSGDMSSAAPGPKVLAEAERWYARLKTSNCSAGQRAAFDRWCADPERSEEHTSELQSLMRISYAVFCLKKKTTHTI